MESQRLCISLNPFLWSIYLGPAVLLNGTVETNDLNTLYLGRHFSILVL